MPLINITPPDAEPVTVDDVRLSARLDATTFDDQVADLLIPGARMDAEHRLGRKIVTQTVELVLDAFPSGAIDLLLPDVQSITSIKYLDGDEAQQTVTDTDYSLDSDNEPCRVILGTGKSWPAVSPVPNAVRVRFVVGYGDSPADVPANIRMWIIAHVVQALDNPCGVSAKNAQPMAYLDHLLDAERFYRAA